MKNKDQINRRTVFNIAGAFVAWVIGSGFATGQEVFQFFSSYGYWSYGGILITFLGFLIVGKTIVVTGYEHREDENFNHLEYFCGKKLGTIYTWIIRFAVLLLMPVLISGAGETLNEYYGINHYIGSAITTGAVLFAYLLGFERLLKVVSSIGPVIIVFSILVGIFTLFRDYPNFSTVSAYSKSLESHQASSSWFMSGLLYVPLNTFCGSVYFTQIGRFANYRKEVERGAIIGASSLVLTILIINTAILLNVDAIASLAIPVLFLARKISYGLGAVFSIVLILGIFSSSSAMMWVLSSNFEKYGPRANKLFAIGVAILAFVISLFPFTDLIGTFYPLLGYIGLPFIVAVIYKGRIKSED